MEYTPLPIHERTLERTDLWICFRCFDYCAECTYTIVAFTIIKPVKQPTANQNTHRQPYNGSLLICLTPLSFLRRAHTSPSWQRHPQHSQSEILALLPARPQRLRPGSARFFSSLLFLLLSFHSLLSAKSWILFAERHPERAGGYQYRDELSGAGSRP